MLYAVFGLFIVAGVLLTAAEVLRIRRCSEPAKARIVGVERSGDLAKYGLSKAKYYPKVEFSVQGKTIQAVADIDSVFIGAFQEGMDLDVRYNPADPEEFILRRGFFPKRLIGSVLLIVVGILGIVL